MSKLSKELHMFVADQWIRGNAQEPTAHYVWGKPQACRVVVGNKYRSFENLGACTATKMLQGAGWYGKEAKVAQQMLQGSESDYLIVERSAAYSDLVYVKRGANMKYLKYQEGNSPTLFLLAAYRAEKKRREAEKTIRAAQKQCTFVERYGATPRKLGDLMPERGHASRMQGPDINVQTLPKPQKLNTLLLHRDLANALEAVNRVLHWGCNERQPPYPETGWKDVPLDKYKQALLRHQSEWLKDPSSLDDESGKLHLAHMATNALILLQRWPEEGKSGSTDH